MNRKAIATTGARRAITRRQLVSGSLAGALGMGLATRMESATKAVRPNIVFILADDLGFADLSCYGRSYSTPGIDSLARDGVLFTQAYSASTVCSPTRAALITGRYPARMNMGLQEPITNDREDVIGLPTDIPTLPSQLRAAGYRTSLIGKWHMGKPPKFGPLKSGYEHFFGVYSGSAFYFGHGKDDPSPVVDGDRVLTDHGYLTDLLADQAIEEVGRNARAARPFFLSLHFTATHWPWEGPNDRAQSAAITNPMDGDRGSIGKYREMLESLDRNVRRVLDALAASQLTENTIVIFTSDNGGERFSDMWPLSGMKGELLEGGIRVPVLARWPARIPAGLRSEQVIHTVDWLPTLVAAAGAIPDPAFPSDGENILPALTGTARSHPRTLFWRHKANDQAAVRDGDLKFVRIGGNEHLFDVVADVRERADLVKSRPQELERLKKLYEAWNAQMLPYPPDSRSMDLKTGVADRY